MGWTETIQRALNHQYPLKPLALCFSAYADPRIFIVGDAISRPAFPRGNSVIAGCFAGVDMARVLLYHRLQHQHDTYVPKVIAEQVDDVVLGEVDHSRKVLVGKVVNVLKDFVFDAKAA